MMTAARTADQRSYDFAARRAAMTVPATGLLPPPRASRPRRTVTCSAAAMRRPAPATPRPAKRRVMRIPAAPLAALLGGAVLGTVLGAAAGNAGLGAAAGAGAGLTAGTAIGADNARHAARDVEADYGRRLLCLHARRRWPPAPATAMTRRRRAMAYGGYPPPPAGYYAGALSRLSLLPHYYGPSVSLRLRLWRRPWLGWHRGFHGGGFRHR